jgi:anti-sigma regulatory factor (Ser/Thr protein kinase)
VAPDPFTLALELPAQPVSVTQARHEVLGFSRRHGLDHEHDVALVVSELCTNAVLHAYRDQEPGSLTVTAGVTSRGGLTVTVADDGVGMHPRDDSPGLGLGLRIAAQLTERLEVHARPDGGAQIRAIFPPPPTR